MGAKKVDATNLKFMTIDDVAEATRYHRKTIARFIREAKIKTVKLNGKRLVLVSEYEKFVKSCLEEGDLEI